MRNIEDVGALKLLPGERVLWSSPRGGVNIGGFVLWMMTALGVLGAVVVTGMVFSAQTIPYTLGASILLMAALVMRIRRVGRSGVFFLTERRIIERRIFWNRSLPLGSVRHASQREVDAGHGVISQDVLTDCVDLMHEAGSVTGFGPTPDAERVCDLINLLVSGQVNASDLPALVGESSPAERRTDVLLASAHRIDGMDFGLLIIGPTYVYRFTERLPPRLEARVFQDFGAAMDE